MDERGRSFVGLENRKKKNILEDEIVTRWNSWPPPQDSSWRRWSCWGYAWRPGWQDKTTLGLMKCLHRNITHDVIFHYLGNPVQLVKVIGLVLSHKHVDRDRGQVANCNLQRKEHKNHARRQSTIHNLVKALRITNHEEKKKDKKDLTLQRVYNKVNSIVSYKDGKAQKDNNSQH